MGIWIRFTMNKMSAYFECILRKHFASKLNFYMDLIIEIVNLVFLDNSDSLIPKKSSKNPKKRHKFVTKAPFSPDFLVGIDVDSCLIYDSTLCGICPNPHKSIELQFSKTYLTTKYPSLVRIQKIQKFRKIYSPDPDSGSGIPEI